MATLDPEEVFLTVPNPAIFGPKPDTLDIRAVICEDLTVTNSMTVDGIKLATDTIVTPAMTLSYIQAVSAAPANIPLALLPKGTGGILVDYPDAVVAGGNLRGNYALDLQFQRVANTQVASGDNTLLAGTISCTASGLVAGVVSSQTSINGGNTSFVAATTGGSLLTSTNSVQIAATTPNMDTSTSCLFIGTSSGFVTGSTRSSIINSSASTLALTTGSTIVASASSTIASANNNFIAASTAGTINGAATFSVVAGSSTARVAGASNRAGVLFSLGSGGIDITGSTDAALIGTNTSTLTAGLRTIVIGADTTVLNTTTRMVVCGSQNVAVDNSADIFVGGCTIVGGTAANATVALAGVGSFDTVTGAAMIGCSNGSVNSTQYCVLLASSGTSSVTTTTLSTVVSCSDLAISGVGANNSAVACTTGSITTCSTSVAIASTDTTLTSSTRGIVGGSSLSQIINNSATSVVIGSRVSVIDGGQSAGIFSSRQCTSTTDDTVGIIGSQLITSSNNLNCLVGGWSGSITGCTRSVLLGTNVALTRSQSFVFGGGSVAGLDGPNDDSFTVGTTGATAAIFYTNAAATIGVSLAGGANAWAAVSDRKLKENLRELRGDDFLEKLEKLPVYAYNFIGNPREQVCLGPMAQDWNPLFSYDAESLKINSGEVQGVLLAAIKALAARVRELEAKIK